MERGIAFIDFKLRSGDFVAIKREAITAVVSLKENIDGCAIKVEGGFSFAVNESRDEAMNMINPPGWEAGA